MSTAVRLVSLAALLLALVVTPTTAQADSSSGGHVSASTFSEPIRTGPPAVETAGRQFATASPLLAESGWPSQGTQGSPAIGIEATDATSDTVFAAARSGASATGGPGISLEQAAAAAERNGLDLSNVDLGYEAPGAAGQPAGGYGYSSFLGDGSPALSAAGRMQITLMDPALASEPDAVATIAHELAHLTMVGPYDEEGAEAYAQQVMAGYVP